MALRSLSPTDGCGGRARKGFSRWFSGFDIPLTHHSIEPRTASSPSQGAGAIARVTKASAPRYRVLFLTVIRHRRQGRTVTVSHRVNTATRATSERTCSLRPHAWGSVGRTEGTSICHQDLALRGAGYRGSSAPQGAPRSRTCRSSAHRQHVPRCSDALRARWVTWRCPGDDEPGLTAGGARSRATRRILDSLPLPTGARDALARGLARVRSHPRAWPPTSQGCTSLRL